MTKPANKTKPQPPAADETDTKADKPADLDTEIDQAAEDIKEFSIFLERMDVAKNTYGEHAKFPHIAHNLAVDYALDEYDGLLSRYASLNWERIEDHTQSAANG